jgi:hypothetical protein
MTDVEIIVIGDVYWDTVVVPLPGGKSDSNPLQPAYARIERRGGAWLLQSMIAAATGHTIKGYGEVNPKEDPKVDPEKHFTPLYKELQIQSRKNV